MDRRITLLVVLSAAMLAVGAGALVMSRRQANTASHKVTAAKLPQGTVPMAAAVATDFTGKAVCGSCSWDIGEECNTMLYDKDNHHVAALLPNDKLAELQKLTGT